MAQKHLFLRVASLIVGQLYDYPWASDVILVHDDVRTWNNIMRLLRGDYAGDQLLPLKNGK